MGGNREEIVLMMVLVMAMVMVISMEMVMLLVFVKATKMTIAKVLPSIQRKPFH